jgi:hypothetical protein
MAQHRVLGTQVLRLFSDVAGAMRKPRMDKSCSPLSQLTLHDPLERLEDAGRTHHVD